MANFELVRFADDQALAQAAAGAWLADIAARRDQPYCVALSGGRIARTFFAAAAAQAGANASLLNNVHFFWSDERCVPPDDAESNFRLARELLLTPLHIASDKIHRLRGEAPVESAAAEGEG